MAPRKQKAPEKKPRSLMARLLSSTAIGLGLGGRGLGRLAMRYPRPALGAAVFLGIFGTIAANALWYQPHRINQPFLATRTFGAFDSLPGLKTASLPAGEVTTYRIERQDDVDRKSVV